MIEQTRLKELLFLDTSDYTLRWRKSRGGQLKGTEAGFITSYGYKMIRVDNRLYFTHILIWLYLTGTFPVSDIDHIDGNRINNSIENLRVVSRSENLRNMAVPKDNSSGYLGVSKCGKKWRAYTSINRRQVHLGLFNTKEEAYLARKESDKLYGFHENHGRI